MMNKTRSNKCWIAICPIESDSRFYPSFFISGHNVNSSTVKSYKVFRNLFQQHNSWNCNAEFHFTTNITAIISGTDILWCSASDESLSIKIELISAKVIVNTMIWMDHTVCLGNQIFYDYLEPFCIQEIGYEVSYFTLNFINCISHKSMWTCSFQPDLK